MLKVVLLLSIESGFPRYLRLDALLLSARTQEDVPLYL